jgi:hypothetical protein
MGDMNCNLASSPLDNNANLLISVADVYGMQQLITDPTRCTELTSTLIDHIFTVVWKTRARTRTRVHVHAYMENAYMENAYMENGVKNKVKDY